MALRAISLPRGTMIFNPPMDPLRFATFCAYLASWLVLLAAAAVSAIPRRRTRPATPPHLSLRVLAGIALQAASALPITLTLPPGPLRAVSWQLAAVLLLAPVAAVTFVWAILSARRPAGTEALVTTGAYRRLRHPIYFAFFAMLLATGLLTSPPWHLLTAALAMFIAGSELRIGAEEAELLRRFPDAYAAYRRRTRWRYLPGLR